jgi:DNA polymerase III psi subunit
MEKDLAYLKYLIDEEIYFIEESKQSEIIDPMSDQEAKKQNDPAFEDTTVIFIDYPGNRDMPDLYKDFLYKILKAVDLDPEKVAMVYSEDLHVITLDKILNCRIITFLVQIPDHFSSLANMEKYEIHTWHQNQVILCDSLESIHKDTTLKRQLWSQLKILYDIQ